MNIRVKFIQAVWDNYQGASGIPIVRKISIEVPDFTQIGDIYNIAVNNLTIQGFKYGWSEAEKTYPLQGIIKIEI